MKEDEVLQWLALTPEFKTAASCKSHLKFACPFAKQSAECDPPLVKAELKVELKKALEDVKKVKRVQWS